jgi:hypothetical protein
MTRQLSKSTLLAALVVLMAGTASAGPVTIGWDPNKEADLAGYVVHYGTASRVYTHKLDVGKVTTATIVTLVEGQTYFFAVQAYSTKGMLSPMSVELKVVVGSTSTPKPPPPPPPSPPPAPKPPPPPPLQPHAKFTTMPGADGRLTSRVVQWTSVSDALAYYLYVGTGSGGKDVVDTGEFMGTSYSLPASMPSDRMYFARIWTKQRDGWRFAEMNFMMPGLPGPARLIAPLPGAQMVTSAQSFLWTEVPGADAYYLYVGTHPGHKDVVDTGEIKTTSYTAKTLPAGQRLYGRIYTKIGGGWYFNDTFFDTAGASMFTYPRSGAGDVSEKELFAWTAVKEAQAYYLQVGTTPGAKDVADSGEILAQSYPVTGLAPGRTYYARVWTKLGSGWVFDEAVFKTSNTGRLLNSGDGSDLGRGFRWTTINGAQAYYLYLGTEPGAKNLIDSGETLETEWPAPPLPAARELFSKMWTKLGGGWRSRDFAFNLNGAALIQPAAGSVASTASQLFTWTRISNAEVYYLYVGSMPGAKDVVDTGEITATAYNVVGLPRNRTLYVTLWTRTAAGGWRHTQSTFITR